MPAIVFYRFVLFVVLGFGLTVAQAQVCAPPASLINATASGIVNNYYVGNGNLSVGNTSLTLGASDARVPAVALAIGDWRFAIGYANAGREHQHVKRQHLRQ